MRRNVDSGRRYRADVAASMCAPDSPNIRPAIEEMIFDPEVDNQGQTQVLSND